MKVNESMQVCYYYAGRGRRNTSAGKFEALEAFLSLLVGTFYRSSKMGTDLRPEFV